MSDMKITGISAPGVDKITAPGKEPPAGFDKLVDEAMDKLSQVQADTEQSVQNVTTGAEVTEAILAMEKADMNFQLMVEVRNKLLSAYQEVMRMQV